MDDDGRFVGLGSDVSADHHVKIHEGPGGQRDPFVRPRGEVMLGHLDLATLLSHTHKHIYIYRNTHTHTQTHTHTHIYTHAYINIHTHPLTFAFI